MPKTRKKLTRAMKIAISREQRSNERKMASRRAKEIAMGLNVEYVVGLYDKIESAQKRLDMPCECDYDCYCDKAIDLAEREIEVSTTALERMSDELKKAACDFISKRDAKRKRCSEVRWNASNNPEKRREDMDLMKVIDPNNDANLDETYYCGSNGTYTIWEREVATPALEALGYEDIRFWNGDGDSFGPLTRVCSAVKGDEVHEMIYG